MVAMMMVMAKMIVCFQKQIHVMLTVWVILHQKIVQTKILLDVHIMMIVEFVLEVLLKTFSIKMLIV